MQRIKSINLRSLSVFILILGVIFNPVLSNQINAATKVVNDDCSVVYDYEYQINKPTRTKKMDLVIVQDVSGSFTQDIGVVKSKMNDALDLLSSITDKSMIVGYSGNGAAPITEPVGFISIQNSPLTTNHSSTKTAIDNLTLGNSTPTAYALDKALDLYLSERTNTDNEVLFILVTDGFPNHTIDGTLLGVSNGVPAYKGAINDIATAGNEITNHGFNLSIAFWENEPAKNEAYWNSIFVGEDNVYSEISTLFNQVSKSIVSKDKLYFNLNGTDNDIEDFASNVTDIINTVKNETLEVELNAGADFDFMLDTVKLVDGTGKTVVPPYPNQLPVLTKDKLTWDLTGLAEGDYKIVSQLQSDKLIKSGDNVLISSGTVSRMNNSLTNIPAVHVNYAKSNTCSDLVVNKVDESNNLLNGAVFEIKDLTNKQIYKWTAQGKSYIKDLDAGKYSLIEVKAPNGYQILKHPINFEIKSDQQSTIVLDVLNMKATATDTEDQIIEEPVDKDDLPTSGNNTNILVLMSFALATLGGMTYTIRRK